MALGSSLAGSPRGSRGTHSPYGNPFIRSALRQVRDTLPRFLSILIITLVGVAFFAGLRLTGPYMKYSAELWLDDRNFMDIQVYSTMGFDENDIVALRSTPGVVRVSPGYHANVLANRAGSEVSVQFVSIDLGVEDGSALLVNSASAPAPAPASAPVPALASAAEPPLASASSSTANTPINSPELLRGRLPTSPNECLVEERWLNDTGTGLGSTIHISTGTSEPIDDMLYTSTFVVVGTAKTPVFIAEDRGNSEIGTGFNSYFFLVLPEAFTYEVYTTAYLQVVFDSPVSRFSDEYFTTVSVTVEALEKAGELRGVERYNKIVSDARKELDEAHTEVDDGYKKLEEGESELENARIKLEDGLRELEDGRAELDDGWAALGISRASLDKGWSQTYASRPPLDEAWAELNASRAQLDESWAFFEATRTQLDEGWALLSASRIQLDEGWAEYNSRLQELQDAIEVGLLPPYMIDYAQQQLAAGLLQLEDGEAEYANAYTYLASSESDYQVGLAELQAGEEGYLSGLAELQAGEEAYWNGVAGLQAGEASYQDGLQRLLGSEASYANGLEEYNEGKSEYEESRTSFEQERADALVDLAQAEEDIKEAELDLQKLEAPRWYVLDLESNPGFRSFKQESEQLESIAVVIPLLFFLIAALVSMTSMTRLVDHDRTIIGTYKALGYTNKAITARYIGYAFSASLVGGIVGIFVGYNLFPPLIFNAFRTIYTVPPAPMFFSWPYAVLSVSIALASTVGPAILVSLSILRETPASAMRPLAPLPGKRIILEHIRPLWHRLTFLHKVTARNLLRYKKRAYMTLFGIAGCTALMFTGFGLNDSLITIGPKQYGQIQRFDVSVTFKTTASPEELDRLYAYIEQLPEIGSYTMARRETADIVGSAMIRDLAIIVSDDPVAFKEYYTMQPRSTGLLPAAVVPYELSDDGIIITEQIARQIGVVSGDTITLRKHDNAEAQFVVKGIMENYVYHYVFMTSVVYEQGFGTEPEPNQFLCLFASGHNSLPEGITALSAVSGIGYTQTSANTFGEITDVLGFVMVILILSAAVQAFVVLFSLNTINREERKRELASIKVLGFFNRELATYIYREGFILTALGVVLGLVFGVVLERYIITTIEIDVFMFSRDLLLTSYLYSGLLTGLFAFAVNLLLYRPLTHIDMVSSLKAVE